MQVEQRILAPGLRPRALEHSREAELLLCLGSASGLANPGLQRALREQCPRAYRIGCSGHGDELQVVALGFRTGRVEPVSTHLDRHDGNSQAAGTALGDWLDHSGLLHVLVFGAGADATLIDGLQTSLGRRIPISGALASGPRPLVRVDDRVEHGQIVAIGLYGRTLKTGTGAGTSAWESATSDCTRTPDFALVTAPNSPLDLNTTHATVRTVGIGPSRRHGTVELHDKHPSVTVFLED